VAFVYALAAFAQLAMGALIDRFELRRLMIGIALVQIPLLALAANLQGWAMLAGTLLMMLACSARSAQRRDRRQVLRRRVRGRVFAVRYVVTLSVAAVAVPMIALLHRTRAALGTCSSCWRRWRRMLAASFFSLPAKRLPLQLLLKSGQTTFI